MPAGRSTGLTFTTLGELRAEHAGRRIPLGSTKQRLLLTVLLSRRNRPVPVREIIPAVWPNDPPLTARKNLQVYVSNLRAAFNKTGNLGRFPYASDSYRVIVRDEEIDTHRFEQSTKNGHAALAAGDSRLAAREFRTALTLWQSAPAPVEDPSAGILAEHSAWLYEQYVQTLGNWAEASIECGDCSEVAEELSSLIRRDPFREGLFGPYLKALVHCGRRTEAISAYGEMRNRLSRELGVSPTPSLERLYQDILAGRLPSGSAHDRERGPSVSLIPRDLPDFVGLEASVGEAARAVTEGNDPVLLWGPAGVGKTSLAVRIAHRLGAEFPDGGIHVRVRGRDGEARTITSILREIAHGTGRPADLPSEPEAAVAAWQRWLAGRRLLLILDDVPLRNDVAHLLPRTDRARVILTARRKLADPATGYDLKVPWPDRHELAEMIRTALAAKGHALDTQALDTVCAGIAPYRSAARIIATQLAALPPAHASEYLAYLASEAMNIDDLDSGGLSLRSQLSSHWRELTEQERLVLTGLSRDLGHDFGMADAATALRCDVRRTSAELMRLVAAGCLDIAPGRSTPSAIRYTIPGLLRQYIRQTAEQRTQPTR